ncbi:response regulator [Xanthobacteraceae bacterium A53D]
MSLNDASTCLVVEDDPRALCVTTDLLEDAGYQLVWASDAEEALRALDVVPQIDCLLTDIQMPGTMNGLELASLVREKWPSIAVVVTSGRERPTSAELPLGARFVAKPHARETLLQALRLG